MNDPAINVAQYLIQQGCMVKTAYFERSQVKVGSEVFLYGYRIIYRVENNDFIICLLERNDSDGVSSHFLKLFNFLYLLGKDIPELSIVRMMIIDNIANPALQKMRRRLIKILIAKGAFNRNIEGDDWLLFDVSSEKLMKV